MTERMASVDDRLSADKRELKRFGKTQSIWWSNGTTWGDITKESEECKGGVERGLLRSQRKCMAKRISFPAVIHRRDNAHLYFRLRR